MKIKNNHVTVALDISRSFKGTRNVIAFNELNRIINLGKEIDLLETIRRQDNPEKDFYNMPKKELELYSSYIGIEPVLLDAIILRKFQNAELIKLKANDEIEITFSNSDVIYDYGRSQIKDEFNPREKVLLDIIAKGMVKPVPKEDLDNAISKFPTYSQQTIQSYLKQTKILNPIRAKDHTFYSSPKIYKDETIFTKLLESNDNAQISTILDFITENPGIPIESMNPDNFDLKLIKGLTVAGAIDPISLNVDGTTKRYIAPSNICGERFDKDHLDQIKKTLANFRFGERYSKWKLHDLHRFLESMIERGYAGKATPIGTDYKNLELAGIVKVQKIEGTKYRFWMLKKDVIEDTIKVLKGAIPLISKNPNIRLHEIKNSVLSRTILSQTESSDIQEVSKAIRRIQRGLI